MHELGLDTSARTLETHRAFFNAQKLPDHIERVFKLAGIESVVMTNDPLDPEEALLWNDLEPDPRFHAALRLDALLNQDTEHTPAEARRFLESWGVRISAVYMAVYLLDSFRFPALDRGS